MTTIIALIFGAFAIYGLFGAAKAGFPEGPTRKRYREQNREYYRKKAEYDIIQMLFNGLKTDEDKANYLTYKYIEENKINLHSLNEAQYQAISSQFLEYIKNNK